MPQYMTAKEAELANLEAAEAELAKLRIEVCCSDGLVSQYANDPVIVFCWLLYAHALYKIPL